MNRKKLVLFIFEDFAYSFRFIAAYIQRKNLNKFENFCLLSFKRIKGLLFLNYEMRFLGFYFKKMIFLKKSNN